MTRADNEAVRRLVLARLGALGRLAPGGHPVLAALGAAAVGVIDGVHGDRTHRRARAAPARAAGLAGRFVHVIGVRHRADRRHARLAHAARLPRAQSQNGPAGIAADQLAVGPRRTRDLAAATRLDLYVVHNGPDRHGSELHGIAGLHVRLDPGHHHVAHAQA